VLRFSLVFMKGCCMHSRLQLAPVMPACLTLPDKPCAYSELGTSQSDDASSACRTPLSCREDNGI
jgi:hypothetical protein